MKTKISSINDLIFLSQTKKYDLDDIVRISLSHVISCKKQQKWNNLEIDLDVPLKNQVSAKKELYLDGQTVVNKNYSFTSLEDIYAQCEVFEISAVFPNIMNFLIKAKEDNSLKELYEKNNFLLGQDLNESPFVIVLGLKQFDAEEEKPPTIH